MTSKLSGLIAATHTPFTTEGALNLRVVEQQAAHLVANGIDCAFICGSTGESHSLTVDERLQLAERWFEVARGSRLQIVVHVGANCLADAVTLARHAQKQNATAVAALAPSYFKPAGVEPLIACCEQIAAACAETPFYYYDIPSMTNVNLSMVSFLQQAGNRIPNLAGLKFTNNDLVTYQLCRAVDNGRFNLLWGVDELLLAAYTFGATGAVGSTYNFAAPVYHRLLAAYAAGDLATARAEQLRSIRLVQLLVARGYIGSAKALMTLQGVDVGPPRLPNSILTPEQLMDLRTAIEAFGSI